ncbi:MAG: tetratricopeptide repeat protein [Balneolaceae bacterium]
MIESKVNKDLEKRIDLYVNGKLNTEEIDVLWADLVQDEYYLDYMKSVANIKAVLDKRNEEKTGSKVYTFRKVAQYAATAAVILIVGIVGVLNFNTSGETSVNPITDIGLDVVRDIDGISETVTNDIIRQAIRLATEGESEEAIDLLLKEMEETADPQLTADLALSLGSIQYNSGDYISSIKNFELVNQQEDIHTLTLEKSYWFLGNAYLQLERLAEAEETFQKAHELNGAYSRVAKTYVDALKSVR